MFSLKSVLLSKFVPDMLYKELPELRVRCYACLPVPSDAKQLIATI
jgi:hypothetical protein